MIGFRDGINDQGGFAPSTSEALRRGVNKEINLKLPSAEADLLVLFEHARQLARLLEAELNLPITRDGSGVAVKQGLLKELAQRRQEIEDPEHGLDRVQSDLEKHAQDLRGAGGDADQYLRWQRLHGALQWTGIAGGLHAVSWVVVLAGLGLCRMAYGWLRRRM